MVADEREIGPEWLENGPALSEPWQAEAFAVAVQLSREGHFGWNEWVNVFSEEIRSSPQREGEAVNAAYYRQWMLALEKIATNAGFLTIKEIREYSEHWRRSYYHTAHGQPIDFRKDLEPIPDGALEELDHDHSEDHEHDHHVGPVAISPALARP